MDTQTNAPRTPLRVVSGGFDHSEEMLAEVDEPPDNQHHSYFWSRAGETAPASTNTYMKAQPPQNSRRESLLTRQLHSETEHTEDEDQARLPPRGFSMVSTWSNQSTASTAELTSDDGRSMPSPATSPPLPPTHIRNGLQIPDEQLVREPRIVGLDAIATQNIAQDGPPEKTVEAGLGRKRCITFACGNKDKKKEEIKAPSVQTPAEPEKPASPPKRKCMIKFACPARAGAEHKSDETVPTKRAFSPPPNIRRASHQPRPSSEKAHRGSDSTVTHVSPRNIRRSPASFIKSDTSSETPRLQRKLSNSDEDDSGGEGTRFHEFGTSEEEPEEWVQESTCHRMRLTVGDTLQKENVIRQLGEEVEEEALEDDDDILAEDEEAEAEEAEEEDEDFEVEADIEVALEEEEEDDDDDESDDGFHSDDEGGFAGSDSDGGDSDYEWWAPAGRSTAATSTDQLDHMAHHIRADPLNSGSSISSAGSDHRSPIPRRRRRRSSRRHSISQAVDIERPNIDLPDSTDFVCGTLDEDRPSEQAYLKELREKQAARHKPMPQDIDPSFPTSDPEMDEEDDDDLEDPEESESEAMVHGDLEELHGTTKRRPSPAPRHKSTARSPPPPRHRSPIPTRHRSPAPAPRAKSPAPRHRSPAPTRRSTNRSPPPLAKRGSARSPPPRKLFGQSPKRMRSPAPGLRTTSPPNTRSGSPSEGVPAMPINAAGLAARTSQLTHTASLPRHGGLQISRMARLQVHEDDGSDNIGDACPVRRGAIDIFKGLEKKRQRRKEKLYQKACAKAAAKGEKQYKVKPGKGCERMREVGLELQRYKGKGEHILSV